MDEPGAPHQHRLREEEAEPRLVGGAVLARRQPLRGRVVVGGGCGEKVDGLPAREHRPVDWPPALHVLVWAFVGGVALHMTSAKGRA